MGGLKELGSLGRLTTLRHLSEMRVTKPEGVSRPEVPFGKGDPLEVHAAQNVMGTLPERIIWKWLLALRVPFEAQVRFFGGRQVKGGTVVDFVVWGISARPAVLRVQGEYWHGPAKPSEAANDDAQAVRLRELGYIVVDLWESDIYRTALLGDVGEFIRRQLGRVI